MSEFGHGPNVAESPESPETMRRNSRWGLILFAVYLALYGGFVLLNAFAPHQMERMVMSGVNLAIVYGFALIAAAFVLALVYGWLCRGNAPSDAATAPKETDRQS